MSASSPSASPQNALQLDQLALVGGLIALFQAAESLLEECRQYPSLYRFTGKLSVNRLQAEVERLNSWMEFGWQSQEADHVGFLAIDAKDILKVLASLDPETRTNMADTFRRVWATMRESVGHETAKAEMERNIAFIRENRDLAPATHASEDVLHVVREGEEPPAADHPNCVIFVRDEHSRNFVAEATVHVEMEDGQRDSIKSTDPDTLYERRYPTGQRIAFKGFKPGYVPGGVEKVFYEGDTEQLVVTIWLKPAA